MNQPQQRVEVIGLRDPDSETELRMFVDGVRVDFDEVVVDPGAGHDYQDYVEGAVEDIDRASPAAAAVLTDWYANALDSRYIEHQPRCTTCQVHVVFDLGRRAWGHDRNTYGSERACNTPEVQS